MAAGYKSHIKKKNQLYFYIPVMNNSKQKLRKQLHLQHPKNNRREEGSRGKGHIYILIADVH